MPTMLPSLCIIAVNLEKFVARNNKCFFWVKQMTYAVLPQIKIRFKLTDFPLNLVSLQSVK